MRKGLLFIVFLTLIPIVIKAQSIEWVKKPIYDAITQVPYDMFKVEIGGKVGLITADGTEILPVEYENITEFKDGIALVTDRMCKQLYAIVYGDKKRYETISGYTIDPEFPYFSDGKLAASKGGKWGFIDVNGNEESGYLGCNNDKVLPYSEGVTFIKKNDKIFGYFDTNGNPLTGNFSSKMVEGYSFHHGQALVFNSNLSWAIVDKSGNVIKLIPAPKQKFMPQKNGKTITHAGNTYTFNNQWCLVSSTINGSSENYGESYSLDKMNNINTGALSIEKSYLCDIMYNGKPIVPAQFENANVLNYEYMAVAQNGKWGVVRVLPSQKISTSIPKERFDFYHHTKEKVEIVVNKPAHMKDKNLEIELKDDDDDNVGFSVLSNKNNEMKIAFEIVPEHKDYDEVAEKKYQLAVNCDGIQYLERSFEISLTNKKGFSVSYPNKTVTADSTGFAEVKVVIRNTAKTKSDNTSVYVSLGDDNESKSKVFNTGESMTITMKISALMSEDFMEKTINIRISENDFIPIKSLQKIIINRYIPEEMEY